MAKDEKWYDKYVTDSGSKENAVQKAGCYAGGVGGLLLAATLATGPIGLVVLLVGGAAAGTAVAAECAPGTRKK